MRTHEAKEKLFGLDQKIILGGSWDRQSPSYTKQQSYGQRIKKKYINYEPDYLSILLVSNITLDSYLKQPD